jgi:hypothetical protein
MEGIMIVTLRSDFHGTNVDVRVPGLPATLTASQTKRVKRELCGVTGCTCGGVRGRQMANDGNLLDVETTYDSNGAPQLVIEGRNS